jgi:hypothetical protein
LSHLSAAELREWTEGGGERERVLGHLARCEACRSALAEVVRDAPVPDAPRDLAVEDYLPRGRAVGGRAFSPARRVARPLALAAGLLAAVGGAALLWRGPAPTTPPVNPTDIESAGVRGGEVQPLSPTGRVAGAVEFRWASPFAAASYRVSVMDDGGRTVLDGTTTSERWRPAAEQLAALEPPRTYTWTVEARDAAGAVFAVSRPASFRLER